VKGQPLNVRVSNQPKQKYREKGKKKRNVTQNRKRSGQNGVKKARKAAIQRCS